MAGSETVENLVLYICELASSALPAFIAFLIARRFCSWRGGCEEAPSLALGAAFSVYLFALLHVTGAGTLHDAMRFGVELNPSQMNLIPFAGFVEDVGGHVLNILLFVPLGAFVFLFSGKSLATLPAVTIAATVSVAIEISQLLNSRVVDIDDLLMNVVGLLVGYVASAAVCKRPSDGESGLCIAMAMTAVAFAARFFVYDEMGIAKVLFGF